ncbi:MAG: hypothetical protein V4537_15985 [Pseudomonadota bacterium]
MFINHELPFYRIIGLPEKSFICIRFFENLTQISAALLRTDCNRCLVEYAVNALVCGSLRILLEFEFSASCLPNSTDPLVSVLLDIKPFVQKFAIVAISTADSMKHADLLSRIDPQHFDRRSAALQWLMRPS